MVGLFVVLRHRQRYFSNIIDYFSSRQVILSHIRCLDFIFPEPEARGIYQTLTYMSPYYLSGAEIIFCHTINPL